MRRILRAAALATVVAWTLAPVPALAQDRVTALLDAYLAGRYDEALSPMRTAGDANADYEDLGRPHGACWGHQHRHENAQARSAEQYGLVARDRSLRREHIHRLGSRDPRYALQSQRPQAGRGHAGQRVVRSLGEADDMLA